MRKTRATPRKPRPMSSAELGRRGEMFFSAICSEVNLLPHRPDYDLNGWDFLVEFPQRPPIEAIDLAGRTQPIQCFVQVKTLWEGGRNVAISLSAAERLGKSPLPSFLCILEASETAEIRRLHVLHMSDKLLELPLRKLREMQASGRSTLINKINIYVPIPKITDALEATGSALIKAFEEAIGPDYAEYRRKKEEFLQTVGFPPLPRKGSFSVKFQNPTEYSDFLLGIKALPVVDFNMEEIRFGISMPVKFQSKPVTMQYMPNARDVEVVWRRSRAFRSVRMKMKAILAPGSKSGEIPDRWRISHPNLELNIDGESFNFSIKGPDLTPTNYRTYVQLHALEELLGSDEPIEVQLLFRGGLMAAWRPNGSLRLRAPEITATIGEILRKLGLVLSSAGLHDIQMPSGPWKDWREHLESLHAMLEASSDLTGTVSLETPEKSNLEAGETEAIFVSAIEFDDSFLAYYATCRARLELENPPRHWKFHMSSFVLREIRSLDKSNDAMLTFAREAEAVTGLRGTIVAYGPFNTKSD